MASPTGPGRPRSQRSVVFPSPVVVLSIVAVAMAVIAFVATRGDQPTERERVLPAGNESSAASSPAATPRATASAAPKPKPKPKPKPIQRDDYYVEVYNNSGITGLAGEVSERASTVGWQVVGTDNWYGTVPNTTVYYPKRLKAAAKVLALDLGVQRTAPAVGAMKLDRLTIVLTGQL